jgi:hypothetical protein
MAYLQALNFTANRLSMLLDTNIPLAPSTKPFNFCTMEQALTGADFQTRLLCSNVPSSNEISCIRQEERAIQSVSQLSNQSSQAESFAEEILSSIDLSCLVCSSREASEPTFLSCLHTICRDCAHRSHTPNSGHTKVSCPVPHCNETETSVIDFVPNLIAEEILSKCLVHRLEDAAWVCSDCPGSRLCHRCLIEHIAAGKHEQRGGISALPSSLPPQACFAHSMSAYSVCVKCAVFVCELCYMEGENGVHYDHQTSVELIATITTRLECKFSDLSRDIQEDVMRVDRCYQGTRPELRDELTRIDRLFHPLLHRRWINRLIRTVNVNPHPETALTLISLVMNYKAKIMKEIENSVNDIQHARDVPLLHNSTSAYGCIGDRVLGAFRTSGLNQRTDSGIESASNHGSGNVKSRDASPFLVVPFHSLSRASDWSAVSRSSSVPTVVSSVDIGKIGRQSDHFTTCPRDESLMFFSRQNTSSNIASTLSLDSDKTPHYRDLLFTKSLPEFLGSNLQGSIHGTNIGVPSEQNIIKSWSPSDFDLAVQIQRMPMEFLLSFGETGCQPGQLNEPNGIAIDYWENIFVADTNNIRIQGFHQAGQLCSIFTQNDGLQYPFGIAVSLTSVIVIERSPGYSVKLYGLDGKFQRNLNSGRMKNLRCVIIDHKGRVIVVQGKDDKKVTIFHENLSGAVFHRFTCDMVDFPRSVTANKQEELFIADNTRHCIYVYTYNGDPKRCIGREGLTDFPVGIYINEAGHLVVIDNHMTFKITVLTQCGQYLYGYKYERSLQKVLDVAVNSRGLVAVACEDRKSYKIHMLRFVDPTIVAQKSM